MSMMWPLVLVAAVGSPLGCKGKPRPQPVADEAYGVAEDVSDAALGARPLVGRARCRQEAELPIGAPFELGGQAPLGSRTLVAIATGAGLNRIGKVVTLDESGKVESARELGKLEPDAPPPILASEESSSAWAAAYFKQSSKRASEVLFERDGQSHATVVPQQGDDAYGLSLAVRGHDVLVAWDEDQPGGNGSHVRVATVRGGVIAHSVILSDAASDADAPQVAATASGFAVAWVNRRSLPFSDAAAERVESPGQAPSFEWIETATLDGEGQLSGRPVDLTARTGHTRAFALARDGDGPLVVMRPDDAAAKGSGARLQVVTLAGDRAVSTVANEGVGRSVPVILRGEAGSWLLQATSDLDQPVVWLKAAGRWSGSHEEGIGHGRVIRALPQRRILVAYGERGAIARLACE
jgi:hypothetical protein